MKKVIINVEPKDRLAALKVVETFEKWYDTPKWDKIKIDFDSKFTVHETKAGTIVVNYKK